MKAHDKAVGGLKNVLFVPIDDQRPCYKSYGGGCVSPAHDRLAKEEERDKVKRGMQKAQAEHTAEMQRTAFEAKQREKREAAEQETALLTSRQQAELAHLAKMRADLELEAKDVSQLLVAREQGAPSKLIQVVGDARAAVAPCRRERVLARVAEPARPNRMALGSRSPRGRAGASRERRGSLLVGGRSWGRARIRLLGDARAAAHCADH